MERTASITAEKNVFNKRQKLSLLLATCLVLGTVLLALASLPIVRAAGSSQATYINVQVFAQTSGTMTYNTFVFTAYNMTGSQIATSQGQYPAASFELPAGAYMFTAEATQQFAASIPYQCSTPVTQGVTTATPPRVTTVTTETAISGAGSAVSIYCGGYPLSEYGYSQQDISSATVVKLSMENLTASPLSSITVKVAYANGTAAAGASISVSVLGASYYGSSEGQMMWGTTDSSGAVTLNAPAAPLQVTAWSWVPIGLPSQTTVQRTVGGEKVNVTVYWEPTTVGLASTTLVIPPQTTASMTLHIEQSNYWVTPDALKGSGVASGVATPTTNGAATGVGVTNSIPASVAQQYQSIQSAASRTIASLQPINGQASTTAQLTQMNSQPTNSAIPSTIILAIAAVALVASGLSLSLVMVRGRHRL